HQFALSEELMKKVTTFATAHQVNTTTIHSLAFGIVLSKHSRCKDFVIGVPAAGRNHPALGKVIGDLVNVLPLRLQLDFSLDAIAHIQQLQQQFYGMLQHQVYPFEFILEDIEYKLQPDRQPLCQAMLSFPNYKQLEDSNPQDDWLRKRNNSHAITATVLEYKNGHSILLECDGESISPRRAKQMAKQWQLVLQQLVEQPNRSLAAISLMEEKEELDIRQQWSEPQQPIVPSFPSVIDAFCHMAHLYPQRPALIEKGQVLEYLQLKERAERMASLLRSMYDVQPGQRVVVDVPASAQQIESMLALWMCEAIYVPISPKLPTKRKEMILADCQPVLVIGKEFWQNHPLPDAPLPYKPISKEAMAYMLYTSGSTGTPKGVFVSHSNLVYKMAEEQMIVSKLQKLVTYCLTQTSFDVSFLENALPLFGGGTVVTPSTDRDVEIDVLVKDCIAHGVNILQMTPTFLTHCLSELSPSQAQQLNQQLALVCVGGESLHVALVKTFKAKLPDVQLNNHYGPTEATIDAIVWEDVQDFEQNIIGRPLPATTAYIQDAEGKLLPREMVGELVLTGPSISAGYWNRPEQTAKAFIRQPNDHRLLYKTGDLAAWTSDGQIRFVGRKDAQLKYRGYRIEPEEIAHCIRKQPKVQDAHVGLLGDNLVAWVVGKELDTEQILGDLFDQLPSYMIPNCLETLTALPRTNNGKIDLNQLSHPQQLQRGYVAPRNHTEKQLARLWQEVLGLDQIGAYDNFFELGGHSLKALELMGAIHKSLGAVIGFKEINIYPVLEKQARFIEGLAPQSFQRIPLAPEATSHPLSSAQRRMWMSSQLVSHSIAHHMPVVFEIEADLQLTLLEKAVNALVDNYEILRTYFAEDEQAEIRQFVVDNPGFAIEQIDLSSTDAEEAIAAYIQRPFDLQQPRLFRMGLLSIPSGTSLLVVVFHHIISDYESDEIFKAKLLQQYQMLLQKEASILPAPAIQYKDYAHWAGHRERQKEVASFWENMYARPVKDNTAIFDFDRPTDQSLDGTSWTCVPDAKMQKQLRDWIEKGYSIFVLSLSAMYLLLNRYTKKEDIVIGATASHRSHPDLKDQIGPFLTLLALRHRMDANWTASTFLEEVKMLVSDAYTHIDHPIDELIAHLNEQKRMPAQGLFQVVLNVVSESSAASELEKGEERTPIRPRPIGNRKSKFPLCLNANDSQGNISFLMDYQKAYFKKHTVDRMGERFVKCLQFLIENPDTPLRRFRLLSRPVLPSIKRKALQNT
ncbi:MAG: amino acid adenylation domain-containing protein, partial [Bacteroidota bacterium]